MSFQKKKTVLIVGAGFVGEKLAETLHKRGWAVTALTRHEESARDLKQRYTFPVVTGDITNPESLRDQFSPKAFDAVVHCASSGRGGVDKYREVFLRGVQNLQDLFPTAFLVFTSSTSVYGEADGSTVTEESVTDPDRETGQVLLQAEQAVLQHGGAVARLAGLYGPGRSVILRKFLSGEARIEDGGERHLNQLHRDDAATALAAILEHQPAGQVFNVSDDHPMTQAVCYAKLADFFNRQLPPPGQADRNRKRGLTNKLVSNAKIHSLGWSPQYPSFLDAVRAHPEMDQPR